MAAPVETPRHRTAKRTTMLDLRFQHFGKWFAQGRAPGKGKARFWVCQCDCGKIQAEIHEDALVEGRATSCGCDYVSTQGQRVKLNDLSGQVIGGYLILHREGRHKNKTTWHCQCLGCQAYSIQNRHSLRLNRFGCPSCAAMTRGHNLTGRVYGCLVVLRTLGTEGTKNQRWECLCRCGNRVSVYGMSLLSGHTTSCGCQNASKQSSIKAQASVLLHYGWWDVLEYSPALRNSHNPMAYCRCRGCGNEKKVSICSLRDGTSRCCRSCSRLFCASLAADLDTWDTMITASAQRQQGVQA